MITTKEVHYCEQCMCETTHIVVLVRDTVKPKKAENFIIGLIKGWAVGPFQAAMDDFTRHSICEKCGKKTINDNLT